MTDTPLPVPSRREARRLSRRESILGVAAQSFLELGYAGTRMSAIAQTLGGSKGTLWSYFPSKELLFGAVIDHTTEAFRAQLSLILNPHDGVETALRRFCNEFLLKVLSADAIALYRLVIGEAGRFPEIGRIFHDQAQGPTQRLLADYIQSAMDRALLRRDDPLRAARLLTGLMLANNHQRLLMGLVDSVDAATITADVDRALAMFLISYAP